MIDPEHDLPIKQQAEMLDISRSTVYYEPRPVSAEDLWLMRHIDELHLNYSFAGRKFYNSVRPHSSLGALTPDQVYFSRLPESMAA